MRGIILSGWRLYVLYFLGAISFIVYFTNHSADKSLFVIITDKIINGLCGGFIAVLTYWIILVIPLSLFGDHNAKKEVIIRNITFMLVVVLMAALYFGYFKTGTWK